MPVFFIKKLNLLLFSFVIALFACSNNDKDPNNVDPSLDPSLPQQGYLDSLPYNEVTYSVVQIGYQAWLGENLNIIPSTGNSWCWGDKPQNCNDPVYRYGRLYDWNAARIVCPNGWRLPSKADFDKLYDYVKLKYENVGSALKSQKGWSEKSGAGSNNYYFSALPGGYRSENENTDYIWRDFGSQACWWSSTEESSISAHTRCIRGLTLEVGDEPKARGLSVRCIRN